MLQLDHVVIAVNELERAVQDYETLGFTVIRGGVHASQSTHNALIVFGDGTYLELLATTGQPPLTNLPDFSSLLKNGEGLVGFALYTDDIEAEAARLQAAGFAIGEILTGTREKDGRQIQWKMALVEDAYAPFLIQDMTPRAWRVPTAAELTTHKNHAFAMLGLEIAVRELATARDRYARLLGIVLDESTSFSRTLGAVYLHEFYPFQLNYASEELPAFLQVFAGRVPQEEIDTANDADEPESFRAGLFANEHMLENHRKMGQDAQALHTALGDKSEALFAVRVTREDDNNALFTLERTHQVRFRHFTGAPAARGMDVLVGLDKIDWATVDHAYGTATDVPDLLRALVSDNPVVRDKAHETLIGSIVHQGTIYTGSVEAIPFLMKLIDAPHVDNKAPLDLLGYITFGGFATPELTERTRIILQEMLPLFIKHLSNPDAKVRQEMAAELALYPDEAADLTPLLEEHINSDEDTQVRATCLTTLVNIWLRRVEETSAKVLTDEQQVFLASIMQNPQYPMAVRFRAALALLEYSPELWMEQALAFLHHMMKADKATLATLCHGWIGGILYSVKDALKNNPEVATQWIIAQASHPDYEVRHGVCDRLRELRETTQALEPILTTVTALLDDASPEVRQSAVSFFYYSPHAKQVEAKLNTLAANDASLMIRTMARNVLSSIQGQ